MTPTGLRDAKAAAIEQWTSDPCGSGHIAGEPGSKSYMERLIAMRNEYAPWMAEELDYAGSEGLDVLDVGCGQGIDVARYALTGARATGVDLTPRHVELAEQHLAALGLDAKVQVEDAERLSFEDRSFDRVSSNGVLHHTPNMPVALREINRVLRPGGRATVIVYSRASFHFWLQQVPKAVVSGALLRERGMRGVLSRGVEYSRIGARPLVRVYTRQMLSTMMRDAGFAEVTVHSRHFRASDTLPTRFAARLSSRLRDPQTLDRLGRIAGWYLVATGIRPGAAA
jgi:ubiquinone/menaquinone biosynthesis C-methylase UbiE